MSEKDLADILKLLIQVPGAMAVLFVVAKWVIGDWFKKKSEIEKLKAGLKNQEIENLFRLHDASYNLFFLRG